MPVLYDATLAMTKSFYDIVLKTVAKRSQDDVKKVFDDATEVKTDNHDVIFLWRDYQWYTEELSTPTTTLLDTIHELIKDDPTLRFQYQLMILKEHLMYDDYSPLETHGSFVDTKLQANVKLSINI